MGSALASTQPLLFMLFEGHAQLIQRFVDFLSIFTRKRLLAIPLNDNINFFLSLGGYMQQSRSLFSLVSLIVLAMVGVCMEIDISIPSFPSIMDHFGSTEAQVQNTLTTNFIAFCLSGLFYGPISDALGRRKLMILGATAFMIGAVGCVFAQSIEQLMAWRFVQGLGAGAGVVLGFSMISDRYQGEDAAAKVGMVNAANTMFMAIAPVIGGLLIQYSTWQANYTAIAAIAVVTWVLLTLYLPETHHERSKVDFKKILKNYWTVMTHGPFMLAMLVCNFLVVAYLTFIGSAAFYYMNTNGLDPMVFAMHQSTLVACFSITSFKAGVIIDKLGPDRSVRYGMALAALASVMFVAAAYLTPNTPIYITISMCVFAVGCAIPMSVIFAKSLELVPDLKGVSSAFIMSTRLLKTGAGIAITGYLFDGSMRPAAQVIFACLIGALVCFYLFNRTQAKS